MGMTFKVGDCYYTRHCEICKSLELIDKVWTYSAMKSGYNLHEEPASKKKNQLELALQKKNMLLCTENLL